MFVGPRPSKKFNMYGFFLVSYKKVSEKRLSIMKVYFGVNVNGLANFVKFISITKL